MCVCEGAQKRATGTRMRADWSGFEGVSGQIMCGGGSVHKESGGDSNAAMLQVWAWAQVAGAGACVCVRGRRREPRAHGCGQTGADLKACLGRSCVGVSCFHLDVPVSGLLSLSYGCRICRRTSVCRRTSEPCSDPRTQSVVRIGF